MVVVGLVGGGWVVVGLVGGGWVGWWWLGWLVVVGLVGGWVGWLVGLVVDGLVGGSWVGWWWSGSQSSPKAAQTFLEKPQAEAPGGPLGGF